MCLYIPLFIHSSLGGYLEHVYTLACVFTCIYVCVYIIYIWYVYVYVECNSDLYVCVYTPACPCQPAVKALQRSSGAKSIASEPWVRAAKCWKGKPSGGSSSVMNSFPSSLPQQSSSLDQWRIVNKLGCCQASSTFVLPWSFGWKNIFQFFSPSRIKVGWRGVCR